MRSSSLIGTSLADRGLGERRRAGRQTVRHHVAGRRIQGCGTIDGMRHAAVLACLFALGCGTENAPGGVAGGGDMVMVAGDLAATDLFGADLAGVDLTSSPDLLMCKANNQNCSSAAECC